VQSWSSRLVGPIGAPYHFSYDAVAAATQALPLTSSAPIAGRKAASQDLDGDEMLAEPDRREDAVEGEFENDGAAISI
jgi:hypothetical protein